VDLPLAFRWTAIASSISMQAEAAAIHARWLRERPNDYGTDVLARLIAGSGVGAAEYARAQAIRGAIRAELDIAFQDMDAIAAPSTPTTAPALQAGALVAGDSPFGTVPSAFHLQRLWSLTGSPVVSAPTGLHPNGSPMAIQIAARDWEEGVALGFAYVAMDGVPASRRAPAIAPLA